VIITDIQQGTEEWRKIRLGKVTASRVADIIAKTKSGYSTSRANYLTELVLERVTGAPADRYANDAMRQGTELEPIARAAYEFETDAAVEQIAFATHPSLPMCGASPDGLIGGDGLVEIKCPQPATHLDTILTETIPAKYVTQMQWQMACLERQWCDFVSFNPLFPGSLRLFIKRVHRDETVIEELHGEVFKFLAEIDAKLDDLNAAMERRAA